MIYVFGLLAMIFLHIVDDYYLQGVLAKMKQKQWWKDNAPDEMYKNDWIPALIAHAFSWTFVIMLPAVAAYFLLWKGKLIIFFISIYIVTFILNFLIHLTTDNEKANEKSINLIIDQLIHLVQVIVTWFLFFIIPLVI